MEALNWPDAQLDPNVRDAHYPLFPVDCKPRKIPQLAQHEINAW